MPDRVVDASVIAAMVFEEPRADEAEDLLRDATLFAPEILPYELASVALKKTQSRAIAALRDRDAPAPSAYNPSRTGSDGAI
jgi:predicted nucleic acid-binding protein